MSENTMPGRRRWPVVSGAVAVALVLVGAIVVVLTARQSALPAPRTLGRDPVPAERIHSIMPANCGVGDATVDALAPDARIEEDGTGGKCRWWSQDRKSAPERGLSVTLTAGRVGPRTPPTTSQAASPVAAAMERFASDASETTNARPVAGLGDEAFGGVPENSAYTATQKVMFRTGDVTAAVEYWFDDDMSERRVRTPAKDLRKGAMRAATDVARSLGAPVRPRETAAGKNPESTRFPKSLCDLVPDDLKDRLVGDDPDTTSADDPETRPGTMTRANTEGCRLGGNGREISVKLTAATVRTPALATPDANREYTRRYLESRAAPPISARNERYFHALSGLGDRAFGAYLDEETRPVQRVDREARVVVQTGPALLTVSYGGPADDDDDQEQVTGKEAVNGAYAVATRADHALP